jgi:hypothetical protein
VLFASLEIVMFRARILAFLAVLLVLLPVGRSAHARYFCRAMDRVMDSCCCEQGYALALVSSETEVRPPDCCVRLTQGALPTVDRRDVAKPISAPALLVQSTPEVSFTVESQLLVAPELQPAVPARGPPLFLKHCVFLI